MNKPKEPIKPLEFNAKYISISDRNFLNCTLKELFEECKTKGYEGKIEDLSIHYSCSEYGASYYDESSYSSETLDISFNVPNPQYKKQLLKYEIDLVRYEKALETYNKWLQSEKPKRLEEKKLKKLEAIKLAQEASDKAYRKLISLKKELEEIL